MAKHYWTPKEIEWLRDYYAGHSLAQTTNEFNAVFDDSVTQYQVECAVRNHNLHRAEPTRFVKGHTSYRKGKTGFPPTKGSKKPGCAPPVERQVGHEFEGKGGVIMTKVCRPDKRTGAKTSWVPKHVWLWEQTHGPRPKGHVVMFFDGDKRNFSSENLVLVHKTVLMILNYRDFQNQPAELRPSILALAKLEFAGKFRVPQNFLDK